MRYWRHSREVDGYVPPDHIKTFQRKLVGLEDGIQKFEVVFGEMQQGGLGLPHAHEDVEQVMYVLEGRMYVRINGEQAELTAGHAVWIPQKVIHEAKNAGPGTLRFIVVNASTKTD